MKRILKRLWAPAIALAVTGVWFGCDGCRYADLKYAGIDIVEFWIVNQNGSPYLITETIDSLKVTDIVTRQPVKVILSPQPTNGYSLYFIDHNYDRVAYDAITTISYKVQFSYDQIDTVQFQFKLKGTHCGSIEFETLKVAWNKVTVLDNVTDLSTVKIVR